ncbi:aldo/keto reductase, partial [Candidatus Neomarinimicrobiota bacterium]
MTKNMLDRKNFLKSTVTGLAGISFLGSTVAPGIKNSEGDEDGAKFIYRTLGNTGIKVPIVSMGVMNAHNPALVKAALDAGITHLDTAHGYQRGRNEEMIGKVVKDFTRDSFTIGTKIPGRMQDSDKETIKEFRRRFDLSLKRLQMDYVDILYLHGVDTPEEATRPVFMEVMSALKD